MERELLFPPLSLDFVSSVVDSLDAVPSELRLGASTAGYQVEGGFNQQGSPLNNWYDWERTGRVPATGRGTDFWRRYPEDLDRAKAMGLSSFRLGLEWSRLERGAARPGGRVQLDEEALQGYTRILAACAERGLQPAVTLHHFTHPHHEGQELWLDGERGLERIVPYAVAAVDELNQRLRSEHGAPPIPYFITVNEPFMYAGATHLAGIFPGPQGSRGLRQTRQVLELLHRVHVALYRALHRLYRERGWAEPVVTFNPWASCVFELDLMLVHILLAPARGVPRGRLEEHLAAEKQHFEQEVVQVVQGRRSAGWLRRSVEAPVRGLAARRLGPEQFQRLIDDVYTGAAAGEPGAGRGAGAAREAAGARLLDAVGLDFYDPYLGDYVELGRPFVRRQPWTWRQVPLALPAFLRLYGRAASGLVPVDLLEQGMGTRCAVGGEPQPHGDGLRRSSLLKAGILSCLQAIAEGVHVGGYYHWSLMDNYEWGSFEPRFGIHGVVYEDGARRLDTDITGEDVARPFRKIADALAAGDRTALVDSLIG